MSNTQKVTAPPVGHTGQLCDDTSKLTPEESAERRSNILRAGKRVRMSIGRAKLNANPGAFINTH